MTVPVYPFEGVTLTVEVLPVFVPAVSVRAAGLLLSAKLGAATAFTITVTDVVCVIVPSVPVTTKVYDPGVVPATVAMFSNEVSAVALVISTEVGAIVHVGGTGLPGGLVSRQLSATVPVYALEGVTVIVEVLPVVAPTVTVMLPLLLNVKVGVVEAGPATIA
jgi:hypothetical protein